MIIGHAGLAYAATARLRGAPVLLMVGASIAPDLVDVVYTALGVCSPYGMYSHSLPALAVIGPIAAAVLLMRTRSRTMAVVAVALVLSHLPLDIITGSKALWPYGPRPGLNLYRMPLADFALELPMLVAGWVVARRAEWIPRWTTSRAMLVALIALQAVANYAQYLKIEKPMSSQSPACRATWHS